MFSTAKLQWKIIYDEYYEHFALDKNFNPPSYFRNREKYIEDYKIKKSLFKGKLITTYSFQKIEGTLFEELTKQLKTNDPKLKTSILFDWYRLPSAQNCFSK